MSTEELWSTLRRRTSDARPCDHDAVNVILCEWEPAGNPTALECALAIAAVRALIEQGYLAYHVRGDA